jgi:hypothetical protein
MSSSATGAQQIGSSIPSPITEGFNWNWHVIAPYDTGFAPPMRNMLNVITDSFMSAKRRDYKSPVFRVRMK